MSLEWSEHLKLGKSSSGFVKQHLRLLPLSEAEFEVDFFLDPTFPTKRRECWLGLVVEREDGYLMAMDDVECRPPTVNDLASLLADAMKRPPEGVDRQRPSTIFLRDRPQWQELLPHLRQLGIEVVLTDDLPRFEEAAVDWIRETKTAKQRLSPKMIKAALRNPFPARKLTWHEATMTLMEWTDTMFRAACALQNAPAVSYDPLTTVSVALTAEEVNAILVETEIGRTKKLRPQLESLGEGKLVDLSVAEWTRISQALCGARTNSVPIRKYLLGIALKVANRLAEALDITTPAGWIKTKCR